MGRWAKGVRALGPYRYRNKWRVVIAEPGARRFVCVETKGEGDEYVREFNREAGIEAATVDEALDGYEVYLTTKGNKPRSVRSTVKRLRRLLETTASLRYYTEPRCRAIYRRWVNEGNGKGQLWTADTHRNYLAETKTFFDWVVIKGWLGRNPWRDVKPTGKRTAGKTQLRVGEARAFYAKAVELADEGEAGAVAALCALVLAMRASEIVGLNGRDIDDDCLVWIADSKTPAGRRYLEAPPDLHAMLADLVLGRDAPVFRSTKKGKRRDRGWVNDWTRDICAKAGVTVVCAHSLRGLHATLAREAGATGGLVAGMLGHESEGIHEKAYAKREAVDRAARRKGFAVISGGK